MNIEIPNPLNSSRNSILEIRGKEPMVSLSFADDDDAVAFCEGSVMFDSLSLEDRFYGSQYVNRQQLGSTDVLVVMNWQQFKRVFNVKQKVVGRHKSLKTKWTPVTFSLRLENGTVIYVDDRQSGVCVLNIK